MSGLNGVKVGDRLLVQGGGVRDRLLTVVSVSTEPVLASMGSVECDNGLHYDLGNGGVVGANRYSTIRAKIATAADIERVEVEQLRREISDIFEPRMKFVISLPLLREIKAKLVAELTGREVPR